MLALLGMLFVHGAGADYCTSATSCVQAGFCDEVGHLETKGAQPPEQHERWDLPSLNRTHLVIRWAPGPALCGQTIDDYVISLVSSNKVFNLVLSMFGQFPQNACDASSPARAAATLGDGRNAVSPCGTYARRCTQRVTETIVEIKPYQWKAFGWAPSDLMVQAAGHANMRLPYGQSRRVTQWCISFRKYDPRTAATKADGRSPINGGQTSSSSAQLGTISRAYAHARHLVLHAAGTLSSASLGTLSMLFTPMSERKVAEQHACS
jgi:hypothetical protein